MGSANEGGGEKEEYPDNYLHVPNVTLHNLWVRIPLVVGAGVKLPKMYILHPPNNFWQYVCY